MRCPHCNGELGMGGAIAEFIKGAVMFIVALSVWAVVIWGVVLLARAVF